MDKVEKHYERIGRFQDTQAFYEQPALDYLLRHLPDVKTEQVVELGIGTGRFARQLLQNHLSQNTLFHGYDISTTMVNLARNKLSDYQERVKITKQDIRSGIPEGENTADIIFSNFLLDIFDAGEIRNTLNEAARVLKKGGYFYTVHICPGDTIHERSIMNFWKFLYHITPRFVGFCRPVELSPFFPQSLWDIQSQTISSYGIAVQILTCKRRLI